MRNIKTVIMLIGITLGMAHVVQAQIFCDEACFYQLLGNEDDKIPSIIRFEGANKGCWYCNNSGYIDNIYVIRQNLSKSINYYENANWKNGYLNACYFHYSSKYSTESNIVYMSNPDINHKVSWLIFTADYFSFTYLHPYNHYKISDYVDRGLVSVSDLANGIIDYLDESNSSTSMRVEIKTRLPKDFFLPKAINNDFYNE